MFSFFRPRLGDMRGASLVPYAALVGIISLTCLGPTKVLGSNIKAEICPMNGALNHTQASMQKGKCVASLAKSGGKAKIGTYF